MSSNKESYLRDGVFALSDSIREEFSITNTKDVGDSIREEFSITNTKDQGFYWAKGSPATRRRDMRVHCVPGGKTSTVCSGASLQGLYLVCGGASINLQSKEIERVSAKVWCCSESDFEVLLETHISLYEGLFIEVLKPLYPKKLTHRWHLLLLLQPFLLSHGSTIFLLALEEKIPEILLWVIFTLLLNKKLENKTKVESWRKALVDASNISGWEPKHIANGHEAKAIKQIVLEISQKLQPVTSSLNENLIGMAARLQGLKLELEIGLDDVRMIGIWGVGGGGKTTLASLIYDEICSKFDGCCFVENIREESGRYGLGKLKEKILSEMEVNRAGGGRVLINNRFRHRKVLIVLDDVDHLDQLKALAGSHDWFGEGSRIIITTRDKHLLAAHKVNVIHNIRLLNNDEAIKLFCKHAPRDKRAVEDYEHLSKEVVSYAGGLPLALTVLGSFLCDKDINEWKSALARLKEIPATDIVEKLRISFDGLTKIEKELFLDIACFFRCWNKGDAMKILDECGFHPVIGVKVLIQKALVTISEDGKFDMHDLVQEMGHHIVRGEHPNNPEKHSRIWKEEDVLKICAMDANTELDMIEAIRYEYNKDCLVQHLPPIVANTNNLRWIQWEGDFASHLLSNFPQRTLCRLILYGSFQKQLWEGYKLLPNLKTVELWALDNLIATPDLMDFQILKDSFFMIVVV
ncbi:unnamed protein product [Lactuca virosa]|uniref:NB-ARC domain-containing protein n=1 Tax=Lactuca virosa TaxID=75947 RepID=A0AAU9N5K3_9ASTR|nr:unnamed protein product [Lactuca virosa]